MTGAVADVKPPMSPQSALRRLLLLTVTGWTPTGFLAAGIILWYLDRGLSIAQALSIGTVTGLTILVLELPTSGFADSFGRRPVYLAGAVARLASIGALVLASGWTGFAVAALLTGIYRALDSGALEAWYVDAVHRTTPGVDVDAGLSRRGTVLGLSLGAGALVAGGLVAWHPIESRSPLELPLLVALGLAALHVIVTAVVLREDRPEGPSWARARASITETPAVIRSGLGLLRTNPVLRLLVLVPFFGAGASIAFEVLMSVRLAELVGGEARAAALMGPITASGWVVFSLGSALAGWSATRIGVARSAILGRVLNGVGVVLMALALGPLALVLAFFATYAMHGFASPMHATLLHREASASNRATVLSISSMVNYTGMAVLAPLTGLLAERLSTAGAIGVIGVASMAGALLYGPAWRAERARAAAPDLETSPA